MRKIFFTLLVLSFSTTSFSQIKRKVGDLLQSSGIGNTNRVNNNTQQGSDTTKRPGFEQRDDLKDSITISYRYMNDLKRYYIDSSVNNFDTYYPVPAAYMLLGN